MPGRFIACQRYIELNPVRAGMVADPAQYRWSSYRANGLGQMNGRLTPHVLYRQLGSDDEERRAAYRKLFRTELDAEAVDDIRKALQLGMPSGSERFAEAICTWLGIRHNSGRRGRPPMPAEMVETPAQTHVGQGDFGF